MLYSSFIAYLLLCSPAELALPSDETWAEFPLIEADKPILLSQASLPPAPDVQLVIVFEQNLFEGRWHDPIREN